MANYNEVSNVTVGTPKVKGAVYVAPTGTTLPTDAKTELNSAFENMGYISEDGVVNGNGLSTSTIKAWGKDTVLVTEEEKTDTFALTFIEALRLSVLKLVYGDENVSGDLETGLTVKCNSTEQTDHALVIDTVLRDGALKRIVVPLARATSFGDVTYSDTEAVGYETTFTAQPDSEGNTHYEYIIKPAASTESETKSKKAVAE